MFTSSGHGLTSACQAWNAKSRRPLWTLLTARHALIPTLHGEMSTLRSTSCDLTAFVHKLDRLRTISHALLSLFGYSALIMPFDTKGILENIKTSKEYGNARADLSMTNS